MSDWYLSFVDISPSPSYFLFSSFTTRRAPASLPAFTASWNFAAGTSPLSVTTPSFTSTVTPVTPYFDKLASTLFLIVTSSEAVVGVEVITGVLTLARVFAGPFALFALSPLPHATAPSPTASASAAGSRLLTADFIRMEIRPFPLLGVRDSIAG